MKPIYISRFNPDKRKLMLISSMAFFLILALLISSAFAAPPSGPPSAFPAPPSASPAPPSGPPIRSGFTSSELGRNDDGSTGLVELGFPINFFGNTFSQGFVNNNGNMTFDNQLGTYTPFGLSNANRVIIAPFFADVDTRVSGSSPVTYGQGTVGSRPAFAANWENVGCYSTAAGGFNSFQMVIIDRSDIGQGDFDIEFNYQAIDWETGTASNGNSVCEGGSPVRIGYSNGTSSSFELAGSGEAGAFLDTNLDTGLIHNSRNSLESGRYIFEVRNGVAPSGNQISGTIFGNDTSNPLAASLVQICTTNQDVFCNLTRSNAQGMYLIDGLSPGLYEVRAFPPVNSNYLPNTIGPIQLAGADLNAEDIILQGPQPLPNDTTISPSRTRGDTGEPVIHWNDPLTLSTQACAGGIASYTLTHDNGSILASGEMQEGATNSGSYSATIPALAPNTGHATVSIEIICPDGTTEEIVFSIYIDPSGVIQDTLGNPVSGARVTLYRSDSSAGPFEQVANGSDIMSPSNRTNPDQSTARGLFGWDVIAGFYRVRAEAEGCTSPNSELSYVETEVLTIPPPVTDLELILDCGLPVEYDVCDIDHDGAVTRSDVISIYRNLRSEVEPGTNGDITGDGIISTQDVRGCTLRTRASQN